LQQYGALIHLGRDPDELSAQAEFSIDLDSGRMPCSLARVAGNKGNTRYLCFGAFVGKLDGLRQPTVPEPFRLKESLSIYLQVRLGRMPPPLAEQKSRNAVLILGFDTLVSALAAIMVKAEDRAFWTGTTKLELVPLSDHIGLNPALELSKSAGTFSSAATMKKSGNPYAEDETWNHPEGEFPCKVYRTEAPGYYLLEHSAGALRPGTLVGLNTDNKLIQVGLVCSSPHEGAPSSYGFELLASDVSLTRIYRDAAQQTGHKALFIKTVSEAGRDRLGLMVPPLKLRSGEGLAVELDGRREKYRIAKQLEATAEFSQFEIVREGGAASA
jgi:hypothetical protein